MEPKSSVKKFLHLVLFLLETAKSTVVLIESAFLVDVVTDPILKQMVSRQPGVRELVLVGSPW